MMHLRQRLAQQLRPLLGVVAVLLYLSYLAAPVAPVLGWKLNQEWIAQNQCKNRWSNRACGGKCILMQRLQAQEQQQQSPAPIPSINTELLSAHQLAESHTTALKPAACGPQIRSPRPVSEQLPATAWASRLLRPPRLG